MTVQPTAYNRAACCCSAGPSPFAVLQRWETRPRGHQADAERVRRERSGTNGKLSVDCTIVGAGLRASQASVQQGECLDASAGLAQPRAREARRVRARGGHSGTSGLRYGSQRNNRDLGVCSPGQYLLALAVLLHPDALLPPSNSGQSPERWVFLAKDVARWILLGLSWLMRAPGLAVLEVAAQVLSRPPSHGQRWTALFTSVT